MFIFPNEKDVLETKLIETCLNESIGLFIKIKIQTYLPGSLMHIGVIIPKQDSLYIPILRHIYHNILKVYLKKIVYHLNAGILLVEQVNG